MLLPPYETIESKYLNIIQCDKNALIIGWMEKVVVIFSNSPTERKSRVVVCKANRSLHCGLPYGWDNFYINMQCDVEINCYEPYLKCMKTFLRSAKIRVI